MWTNFDLKDGWGHFETTTGRDSAKNSLIWPLTLQVMRMDCEGAEYELLRTGYYGDILRVKMGPEGQILSGRILDLIVERKMIPNPSKGLWKWFELNGQ